ncbi:site-specific DNA-methyltransferase [Candidatus Sumerlaeota bacterium]|nr:site-specific DNA-methyltransferase [Candidatus Sumerlaeota bacterium]
MFEKPVFFNEDCVEGCRRHIPDGVVDLIVTDPPYGIEGDRLHKHYNRKEEFVLDGYVEVPADEYGEFSRKWIAEAERILRPGGSIYIVSGYTNLIHVLNALRATRLQEVNHIVWKYNFGVHTTRKYVSSHYHILFYRKPGGSATFNTHCRFGASERGEGNGSLNYQDREDVWVINREYKPGKTKNKNELPSRLLMKMIQYSSNEGDLVCDLFLGGFSTARIALGMNRRAVGFELSKTAFAHQAREMATVERGALLRDLRVPEAGLPPRQGLPWGSGEKERIASRFAALGASGLTKKKVMDVLSREFGRGYWSLEKVIKTQVLTRRSGVTRQNDLFADRQAQGGRHG